jgi:hypothetical protein
VAEVPHQLDRPGADRQIRDSCAPRRDLTIPGKHKLVSYLRRAVLVLLRPLLGPVSDRARVCLSLRWRGQRPATAFREVILLRTLTRTSRNQKEFTAESAENAEKSALLATHKISAPSASSAVNFLA